MSRRRAAIYIRMSTDEQASSPERQRLQIEAYCERNGYTIVKRYEDLGQRGNDDGRPDFNRLIADASRGLFDVVVVDEQSRLTRNDPVSFIAMVVHPLRTAGVIIDTVAKGQLDWDDLGGFIVGAVSQHAANGEVATLSRRLITDLARRALNADLVPGKAPYGYKQVWRDRDGEIVHRGKRSWNRRPEGLIQGLEIDPEEAETVRWIFDSYVNKDVSISSIMRELHSRGIVSPKGNAYWNRGHIRKVLKNRAYVGDFVYNRLSTGAYHRLAIRGAGSNRVGVAEPKKRKSGTTKNPESDWVVATSNHAPIIERELFVLAQAALQSNRERTKAPAVRNDYPLSRLLVCAKCSNWLVGARDRNRGKHYICSGYTRWGSQYCRPFRVREDEMLSLLDRVISERFLNPELLAAMRADAANVHKRRATGTDITRLEKVVNGLTKKIDKATKNILLLDASLLAGAQAQLREWESERADAYDQIQIIQSENPVEELEALIEIIESNLKLYREGVTEHDLVKIREALRGSVIKIELNYETVPKGNREWHHLVGGVAHFVSGESYAMKVVDAKRKREKNGVLSTSTRGSVQRHIHQSVHFAVSKSHKSKGFQLTR